MRNTQDKYVVRYINFKWGYTEYVATYSQYCVCHYIQGSDNKIAESGGL